MDVPAAVTLPEVHDVLQVAIGWTDSHLHEFETATGLRYGRPDPDFDDDSGQVRDETTATLRDLPPRFTYRYDFGDGWEHDVEVTGRGDPAPGCVDGEGACPPEDCGGPHGYAELLEALADPAHPDHDHLSGWAATWSPTWTDDDRGEADRLVRATVGQVPASVRLLLDLIGDTVRLTPGGRLPRALVRAVQDQRPGWAWSSRPAALEEDLPRSPPCRPAAPGRVAAPGPRRPDPHQGPPATTCRPSAACARPSNPTGSTTSSPASPSPTWPPAAPCPAPNWPL